jgi:hypothetical protein
LEDVKAFEKASLRGEFYESFDVNRKNSNEICKSTSAWIAEFERLFNRCIKQAKKTKSAEMLQAFEICFSLLKNIDEGADEIIFFADEGGSWQVGIDWTKAFPAYFKCLSPAVEPDQYARRVLERIDDFARHDRALHIAAATKMATADQRKSFEQIERIGKPQKAPRHQAL